MTHKTIGNVHFIKLKDVINSCVGSYMGGKSIISDIQNASKDDTNGVSVYPSSSPINLDVIKLDELTRYCKEILSLDERFEKYSAVDAICINDQNEWFFIEFKNSDINENRNARKSIKKRW